MKGFYLICLLSNGFRDLPILRFNRKAEVRQPGISPIIISLKSLLITLGAVILMILNFIKKNQNQPKHSPPKQRKHQKNPQTKNDPQTHLCTIRVTIPRTFRLCAYFCWEKPERVSFVGLLQAHHS